MKTKQENWKQRYLPTCIILPGLGLIIGYIFKSNPEKAEIGRGMVKASWTWFAIWIGIGLLLLLISS